MEPEPEPEAESPRDEDEIPDPDAIEGDTAAECARPPSLLPAHRCVQSPAALTDRYMLLAAGLCVLCEHLLRPPLLMLPPPDDRSQRKRQLSSVEVSGSGRSRSAVADRIEKEQARLQVRERNKSACARSAVTETAVAATSQRAFPPSWVPWEARSPQ